MTEGQYRALVAYMNFWYYSLDKAIADIGITDDRKTVIDELSKAGWNYDGETELLTPDEAI